MSKNLMTLVINRLLFIFVSFSISIAIFASDTSSDTSVASSEVAPVIEINIPDQSTETRASIQQWLASLSKSPSEGARDSSEDMMDLTLSSVSSTRKTWQSMAESYAKSSWDPIARCPNTPDFSYQEGIDGLVLEIPGILAETVADKVVDHFFSAEHILDLPLVAMSAVSRNPDTELTDKQTVMALGATTAIAAAIGSAYLQGNEIDFARGFTIPVRSEALKQLSLKVAGENIGFRSKNPYFELGSTVALNNGALFSLTGGITLKRSRSEPGKDTVQLLVAAPVIELDRSSQTVAIRGGVSPTYKGTRVSGGSYNGSLTYLVIPRFNIDKNPAMSNVGLEIGITPFALSSGLMLDSSTERPAGETVESSVSTAVKYTTKTQSAYTTVKLHVKTGAEYQPSEGVRPTQAYSISLTVSPRKR